MRTSLYPLVFALGGVTACVDDATTTLAHQLGTGIEPIPEPCDPEIGECDPPPPPPMPCSITIITAAESPVTIEEALPLPWEHVVAAETPYGFEAPLMFSPLNRHFTIVLPSGDPGGASEPSVAQSSYCVDNLLFLHVTKPMPLTVYASDGLVTNPDPIPTVDVLAAAPPARRQKEGKNVEAATPLKIVGAPGELPPGSTAPGAGECSEKVEFEIYKKDDYKDRDVYTGPAVGGDTAVQYTRDAIAAAGKAVKTVDNVGAVLPVATQWGEVVAKPDTNRKHMSLGHGNKSLAVATTNDRFVDNNAAVQAAAKASGKVNNVEFFHCCTGARFTVKVPDGPNATKPWPDQLLRAYQRQMPAAGPEVAGYDQMVAASKAGGGEPAKLWRVKDHIKYTAKGNN